VVEPAPSAGFESDDYSAAFFKSSGRGIEMML
jgi:hypothetical protein